MPSRIYSTRFDMEVDTPINGHYNTPLGMIGIVRDMRFYLPNGGDFSNLAVCEVNVDDTGNVIWQIKRRDPAPGVYTWHGHQVFLNTLGWIHYSTTARLTASGYLLTIP